MDKPLHAEYTDSELLRHFSQVLTRYRNASRDVYRKRLFSAVESLRAELVRRGLQTVNHEGGNHEDN